ncbi:acyl-CoA reductase [Paeniglutamicibacter sp. MACA_103]|uniref:acyl-CoA reductase n=1 Tax=Paeniglutamicibacter sp. MACA_103 TaxID=3377337 RepID=UPI0038950BB6
MEQTHPGASAKGPAAIVPEAIDGFFLPQLEASELRDLTWKETVAGSIVVRTPEMTSGLVDLLAQRLLAAQEAHLANRPVMDVVDVLGRVFARWADPDYHWRVRAEAVLPAVTGYAPAMVRRGLARYLQTFRRDRLLSFLTQDLENPLVLDGFKPNRAGGRSRAVGPRLTTQIHAGNVPGLAAWNLVCALLVKSATLGKSASGEPLFAVFLAHSIAEEDPDLATCLAMVHWAGGNDEIERAAFAKSDAVVVTGGDAAIAAVSARVPPGVRLVAHGHKVSFAVVGIEALTKEEFGKTAVKVAYDASQYDQQGCLSPHAVFVQRGGEVGPEQFAASVAEQMQLFDVAEPRARLGLEEHVALDRARSTQEFRSYTDDGLLYFTAPAGNNWTVVYDPEAEVLVPSPLNRFLRIHPVDGIDDVVRLVAPLRRVLQTVGVACSPETLETWSQDLAGCGVDRICGVGRMPEPAAGWHHDGVGNLTALVRWIDIEQDAGLELER